MLSNLRSLLILPRLVFFVALIILIMLTGCYSNATFPAPQQEEFILKLRKLSTEIDTLTNARSGKDGKLPPKDLEDRIKIKEAEIFKVLREDTLTANSWNASINRLERRDNLVIIHASYKEHLYELRISNEKAKDIVETTFAKGDDIFFSGNIGPERSASLTGAFFFPEFIFFPTVVRKGATEIRQP